MNTITTIIISTVTSGALTALVVGYFNRGKSRAEVHNMNIEGDLKVGDNWREYAKQITQDMRGVKQELTLIHNKYLDLERKYYDLYSEHTTLIEEGKRKDAKIQDLELKVKDSEQKIKELQEELSIYKISNIKP